VVEGQGQGQCRERGRSLSMRRCSQSSLQSPVRGRSVSPDFAHATYAAVQAAMHRRQVQVMELRARLRSSRDDQHALQSQLDDATTQRHRLQQSVTALSDDKQSL